MQCTEVLKYLLENLRRKKEEAISRPKPAFVPKTLSDLNIETLSMNSGNSDGFNNNGGRFSNLNRSKANIYASHQNLSTKKTNPDSVQNFNRNKLYGSQQSLSSTANTSYNNNNSNNNRNVNNNYYSSIGDSSPVDRWLNAWDDNNNFSQAVPASTATAAAAAKKPNYNNHNKNNNNNLYNNINIPITSNSNNSNRFNFKQPSSAVSVNQKQIGSQKNFNDDPWSGESILCYKQNFMFTFVHFFKERI